MIAILVLATAAGTLFLTGSIVSLLLADRLRELVKTAALDYLQIRTAARISDIDIERQQLRLLGGE